MTVGTMTKILDRLEDYLPKWKGVEREAIVLSSWFDKSNQTKCGTVGCVGGWARHIYHRDPYEFFHIRSLGNHFHLNDEALSKIYKLFVGKEKGHLSDYVEGKQRLTGMVKLLKTEIKSLSKEG